MHKKDEDQEPPARHHSEAPAEGDRTADPSDTGMHAQEPAEGPDSGDKTPDQ